MCIIIEERFVLNIKIDVAVQHGTVQEVISYLQCVGRHGTIMVGSFPIMQLWAAG